MEEPFRIQTIEYKPLDEHRVAAYLAQVKIVTEFLSK